MELTLVDSGVWIDYLRDVATPHTLKLDSLLGERPVLVGDLIMAEVLRGFDDQRLFLLAIHLFSSVECLTIGGREVAIEAAQNYRLLRARGITPRGTIDTLIATRCILDDTPLLYSDRDFDPFVTHLGLRPALNLLAGEC